MTCCSKTYHDSSYETINGWVPSSQLKVSESELGLNKPEGIKEKDGEQPTGFRQKLAPQASPQSTPSSSPFFIPSLQVGQLPQGPPQSIPDSPWFCIPSKQEKHNLAQDPPQSTPSRLDFVIRLYK